MEKDAAFWKAFGMLGGCVSLGSHRISPPGRRIFSGSSRIASPNTSFPRAMNLRGLICASGPILAGIKAS